MSSPTGGAPDSSSAPQVPTCYRHPDRETYVRCQRCDRPICPDCMRSAAVGHQCPTCVAEGAKQTRSGRTAYGGQRSANPALTTQILIGLNALVWVLILATGGRASAWVDRLGLVPRGRCLDVDRAGYWYPNLHNVASCGAAPTGDWHAGVATGAPWELLTSMFTHVEIWHIGLNMLTLWFLGPQVEAILGRSRYLALYLLSGLTGSIVVLWLASPDTATVGASGALFGLMGALLVLVHKVGGDLRQIGGWLLLNAFFTFTFHGISWQGHLGGFIGGVVITAALVYAPRARRGTWQLAALSVWAVVLAVAAVVRVGQLV